MRNNRNDQENCNGLNWAYILDKVIHQRYFNGLIGSSYFFISK